MAGLTDEEKKRMLADADYAISRMNANGDINDMPEPPAGVPTQAQPVKQAKPKRQPVTFDPLGGNRPLEQRPEPGRTPITPTPKAEEWHTGDGIIRRTRYGAAVKAGYPDGTARWEDNNGTPIETPKSLQMMEAANRGFSPNQGTAASWDDAIRQQQAAKLENAKTLSQQRYEFMRKSLDERKRMRAERDFTTAEAAKNALRLLDEGEGEIKTHQATGKKYRVVKVGGSAIESAERQSNAMGRRSSLRKIAAYVQVNDDGTPVEGAQPSFYMVVGRNNGDGAKDTTTLKPLDFGRVMKQYATSFAALNGMKEDEAYGNVVSEFGGRNPFGWKTGVEKPASVQAAQIRADSAKEVQGLKNQGALEVAAVKPSGKGGKSEEELALERERLDIRRKELEARVKRGEDSQQLREDIFAYNLAKDGYGELSNIFSKATPEQKQAFINDYFSSMDALKNKYGGGKAPAAAGAAKPGKETAMPEFDPKRKDYKAGDRFKRNGIVYEVGADGQPHKVN